MQQRQLGPGGPLVGAIGLGTGPVSIPADRPSVQEVTRLLARAAELGVTLWDTADAYCQDESEAGYGERLCQQGLAALPADLRERIVIATKGGSIRPGGAWKQDGSPRHLQAAIDASLRALQTDAIDLWQLHAPDDKVPFADSMGAIAKARQQGKIKLVGLSNVSVAQVEEAMRIVPLASIQNRYAFDYREPEEDGVLEICRELGLAFLPYSPLGGQGDAKRLGESGPLATIAEEVGATPQQVVLAWMLHKYAKMIPIPGVSRIETLESSARAAGVTLSTEHVARLDGALP
ncbi:MAG: aldo/keto reductase [Armatimonadota bacterium]|nr:aldo/keto reductase [Armatimonadota bacterium]